MRTRGVAASLLLAVASVAATAAPPDRLAAIRARGELHCGVWPEVRGFAIERAGGGLEGFDIDLCRAIAAAVLGDGTRVRFVRVATGGEFLAHDDLDVAIRRLSRTPSRESAGPWRFGPVTFHDDQAFLVPTSGGLTSAAQLAGERVCVLNREHHPRTVADHFRQHGQAVTLVLVDDDAQAEDALRTHRCAAYSADRTWLAAARAGFTDGLAQYALLPESIASEPLAPLMRRGDVALANVVDWTVWALLAAEEDGIGMADAAAAGEPAGSGGLRGARTALLDARPGEAAPGARGAWLRAVVGAAGNYGEIFARHLGPGSALQLERGPNRLQRDGGWMSTVAPGQASDAPTTGPVPTARP